MNWSKKLMVRIFIILYGISYFLQNSVFIDRKKVYGAENPSTTNLVAVFVDKNIYEDIKANLVRYTISYIQKKIANSKAVVFPIDTQTLKAHEISQMLENMYFEGLKDESSKLVGTILIGDVPLPVVQNNGFIYPSIYPYVDFEHQQFIYDTNKKFFIENNNPNGQAEIWHGIIKFDTAPQYNDFFKKVKSYYNNPTGFIDKAIRYEDFIGLKKYFIPENTKYYINSMIFAEDIGYHRFNNLLLNILKDEHNQSSIDLSSNLKDDLQNVTDPELKAYATDIDSRNTEAGTLSQQITSSLPTLTLKTATQEMMKWYDGLISSQFLAKVKDNIGWLARRYKTTEGETFTDYSSVTDKIVQKDNRIVGDADNNIQPLIIQINDYLEGKLNDKIEQEKYYMNIPIPVSELDFQGTKKIAIPLPKCIRTKYNYYENYYFGKNAEQVNTAQDTNIYRWTFQNLTSLSGQNITTTGQSIGWSYKIFSTQIEANRWYNFNSTQEEVKTYDILKTNKQSLWNKECNLHLFGYCIRRKKTWKANDSDDENKCYINDTEKQGGCETMKDFSQRYRGGASVMNMDSTTQKLSNYNYKDARFPIYDIVWSKKIDTGEAAANSYIWAIKYASIIQERFAAKEKQENRYSNVTSYIDNPNANGIDLKFTNQIVSNSDLEHPVRAYNPPKTYAQNNFFTIYPLMSSHKISAGKAILYTMNPGVCWWNGNIYTYKTIDSRVKNTSPTRDQISSVDKYKFKGSSDLETFYTNVMRDLSRTKTDIINKQTEFSGTDITDITGVNSNLTELKKLVASGNNGMQEIIAFAPASLLNMTTAQITGKALDWSNKNLNQSKIIEISGRVDKINNGLDTLLDYMNNLNITTTSTYFTSIIQSERFKNQKVEILETWKNQIKTNLDYITTNINAFKNTFTQARGIYNTIGQLNNNIVAIQAKKIAINAVVMCGAPTPVPCWCDINHYKAVCDVLDTIAATLQSNLSDINDKIDKIHLYQGDGGQVQPFVEINQLFSSPEVFGEITQIKTLMNTFDISTDPEKKETNKGMNLTTQDRPIDNIRNITFQGIGGDAVRLNYPNLYEVQIYKKADNKLILKGTWEIREAIKTYLTNKAVEYNTLLQTQLNKKNQYYQSFSAQFNFLGQLDPLANPNTHNYTLLPTDYFINQIISFLDTIKNAPEYGKKAIYGDSQANTIDEKLDMIAKLFYYQNITRPERLQQSTVTEDIVEIKNSFDINQKISQITNAYLKQWNDQGKFITPVYNTTWYEVGYINSDGEDYVSAKTTPAFIQQIQSAQAKKTKTTPRNAYEEWASADLQEEVDSCEWVDTDGAALLVKLSPFSSPWGKAMVCRAKKILKKPFDIQVSFKNSLGPVFLWTTKELMNTVAVVTGQRTEYGAQRSAENNEETIKLAETNVQEILQWYSTYGLVNIDKTIVSVNETGAMHIKILMAQDMGKINVKISWTGDNCLEIGKNGVQLSNNICTKKAQEYYNPYTENIVFDMIIGKEKKSGSTAIKIELCPAIGNKCIIKKQIINIMPGPIAKINIQSPDIVMEWAEIPVIVSAVDAHENKIGQNVQAYTISVNSGDGRIFDGASRNSSIGFDNFSTSSFIYQGPSGSKDNRNISITVKPDLSQKRLWGEVTGDATVAQKAITVAKGIITVLQNNIVVYQNNIIQKISPKITYNLPKEESDIQYTDSGNLLQIKPENIPSLVITVKDKNGKALETAANITSKQGLLIPWIIKEKMINTTQKQISFSQANDFVITSWKLSITLYPSFKAGNDTITINIPGIDPIVIPVLVNPWKAKSVLMKLENTKMDFTEITGSKWTVHVVDSWNNKVTSGTTIKIWVIGSAKSNIDEFIYTGKEYAYTIAATGKGGEGYVFAYIKDRALTDQMPWYERFIIQDSIIPKDKLNIMYLNLFWTDRGNQRWYFSENNKVINNLTQKSEKLLATTTQIVDPSKIKQIAYIIDQHGEIQSIDNKASTLIIENKEFVVLMPEIAKIRLGAISDFKIQTIKNTGDIATFKKKHKYSNIYPRTNR